MCSSASILQVTHHTPKGLQKARITSITVQGAKGAMAQEAGAAPARPSPAPSSLGSKSGQDVPPSEPDLEGFSGDEKNGRVQHGLSMAQRIMHSLSGTVASFTGTRQQQLVTHYSSVAALSGETADELCAKPTSWLEGDVVLANVSVAKIVGDTVFVSRSETANFVY